MPRIDIVVRSEISNSPRVRQLEGMFDVPRQKESVVSWKGDLPIEGKDWNVGLIVGPSGCGKSTILRECFGEPIELSFDGKSVIDDFPKSTSMEHIAAVCQAVGFNTIPSWMRPYGVLSNGEKFRVDLARRLIEANPVVIDEFTSVVDRQVAQIGSYAVQKYVRKNEKQFVAASCHYDIVEWLDPDWVLEPATMAFQWRERRRRPQIECEISRVDYAAWKLFAPYHYMSADLARICQNYVLFVSDKPACLAAVIHRPKKDGSVSYGISRLVTLPDYQGLGLAFVLADYLGSLYKANGKRLATYPAHPSLIRSFDRNPRWTLVKRPGRFAPSTSKTAMRSSGRRPNATFRYIGLAAEKREMILLGRHQSKG
jgi:ABC-type lipoprotein export system ATPase subunit